MREAFELSWTGGAAARFMRRRHPEVDDYPWGTLRPSDYPDWMVDCARESWTEGAYNEYCTGAAFAHLVKYMLEACVPIDLVAMAGEFVSDEMLHVELNSRIAMELGGGVQRWVDFDTLIPELPHLTPLQKVNELMIRISCVGESFSVPVLTGTMRASKHPLMRAVLNRIVKDEAPHALLGWLYFDWIGDSLDQDELDRLAMVAVSGLHSLESYWKGDRGGADGETLHAKEMNELGWMDHMAYGQTARRAVLQNVVRPLSKLGIIIPAANLDALMSDDAQAERKAG